MNSGVESVLAPRSVRRVGKNAIARLSAQVWARLLSLALVALVARYEGTAGLGRYVLVLTVVGFAAALSDLGLNIFLTREAARDMDAGRQRELLGTVLPLKAVLAVSVYAGLLLVAQLVNWRGETGSLILLGALSLLPESLLGAMGALINARRRMEVTGLLNMTVRLVAVVGGLLALVLGQGIAGVLACTVGASVLGVVLYGAVLWRWRLAPRYRWSLSRWRACLSESYPFALTAVIAMLYARLDLVLLSVLKGDVVAGWYGAAYKLWEAAGLVPASLLDALFPEMSQLAGSRAGLGRLRSLFQKGGQAMLVGGLLLATAGALGAGLLIPLVYGNGDSYAPAVVVFRLLVWALPAMFLYLLSGHTLYALGKQRRVTVAMLMVGLANMGLNLLVIPRWSYKGAGAVALATEWLLWGLLYPQARRALAAEAEPVDGEV